MRIFRGSVVLFFVIILMVFCLDNRGLVSINLGSSILLDQSSMAIELPLFFIVLLAVSFGFLLGSMSEFFRGYKYRAEHRNSMKDLAAISNELKQIKSQKKSQKDELLALLK